MFHEYTVINLMMMKVVMMMVVMMMVVMMMIVVKMMMMMMMMMMMTPYENLEQTAMVPVDWLAREKVKSNKQSCILND